MWNREKKIRETSKKMFPWFFLCFTSEIFFLRFSFFSQIQSVLALIDWALIFFSVIGLTSNYVSLLKEPNGDYPYVSQKYELYGATSTNVELPSRMAKRLIVLCVWPCATTVPHTLTSNYTKHIFDSRKGSPESCKRSFSSSVKTFIL